MLDTLLLEVSNRGPIALPFPTRTLTKLLNPTRSSCLSGSCMNFMETGELQYFSDSRLLGSDKQNTLSAAYSFSRHLLIDHCCDFIIIWRSENLNGSSKAPDRVPQSSNDTGHKSECDSLCARGRWRLAVEVGCSDHPVRHTQLDTSLSAHIGTPYCSAVYKPARNWCKGWLYFRRIKASDLTLFS